MYDAVDIARYVVNYSWVIKKPVTNLRLQKILYFIQGAFISIKNELCFDNDVECWEYGPVVPKVYSIFREYGYSVISKIDKFPEYDFDNGTIKFKKFNDNFLRKSDKQLINEVVDFSAQFTTAELVSITHSQDLWQKNYNKKTNH